MQRAWVFVCCFVFWLLLSSSAAFASELATLTGYVSDPKGLRIPQCRIQATNVETNVSYTGETNEIGLYRISAILVGNYRVIVQKTGFKTIVKEGLELHVQDVLSLNFQLEIGSVAESVNVEAGTPLVNTESASVSTVVDRNFVERLPLNGRSFNTLLQLTPGVVIAPASDLSPGQFTVNGQRTNANSFQVDGVSANFGVGPNPNLGESGTGTQPAFNAYGGTSALVSVDALQEFRVQTSSFAPEYGRTPGGQIELNTRSGTNDIHGSVFNYFRNDVLDANDWFSNNVGLRKAALRQNDFGGTLGGPIVRDKTFFFLSYEGLRLILPSSQVIVVPSLAARATASPSIRPLLNALPLPNGPDTLDATGKLTGTAQFTGSYSNKTTSDTGGMRIDQVITKSLNAFIRINFAPSNNLTHERAPSIVDNTDINTTTLTFGLNAQPTNTINNSLRLNYSKEYAKGSSTQIVFNGSTPFPEALLFPPPFSSRDSQVTVGISSADQIPSFFVGDRSRNSQRQFNLVDDVTILRGKHQLKVGVDFRRQGLDVGGRPFSAFYLNTGRLAALSTGRFGRLTVQQLMRAQVLFVSTSLYAQDSWHINDRLVLTYGLRWEMNPAPKGYNGTILRTFDKVDNPSTLSPVGTPLWNTTYKNFAPRFGVAYTLTSKRDLVLRGGGGLFYDLGFGPVSSATASYPNRLASVQLNVPVPLSNAPVFSPNPPFGIVFSFDHHLQLPRSWQWNAAVEKSFDAERQAFSLTYLGQVGRRLLSEDLSFLQNPPVGPAGTLQVIRNAGTSDYQALQAQFRQEIQNRLITIINYTWSHSIDEGSDDSVDNAPLAIVPRRLNRGSSSFDVRHNFSVATDYQIPCGNGNRLFRALCQGWSIDGLVEARAGFPVDVVTNSVILNPIAVSTTRPDRVPGIPVYLSVPSAPGGKILNRAAFVLPTTPRQGNLGRNSLPGFGFFQANFSAQRRIAVSERLALNLRLDVFNVSNHPNFENPFGNIDAVGSFGKSRRMLNNALGGLSPLYQIGGPRSMQISARLVF